VFTIKFKLILAYTLAFGIMLTVFAAIIYDNTKEASFMKLDTNLKSYSITLRTEIEDELQDEVHFDTKKLSAVRAKGLVGEKYQLFDARGGTILRDSSLAKIPAENINEILENSFVYGKKRIDHRKYRILWSAFETQNDSVYILETAASVRDVFEDLDRMFYLFLLIIPAGLILTGVAAYFISRAAFKPVVKMTDTAKNISGKNLDLRLELPKAKDEIRALGETLNDMIERIDNAFKSQKQFIANASHEIRTPLTVIQTELEILEKQIKNAEFKESIKNALSEIENLTKLTSSLLTIAKLDVSHAKLNISRIRIDELLADCVQTVHQAAIKKNIKITLSLEEAIEIEADKEKLKSVYINLIDNAIKYSNPGSHVMVTLKRITGEKINVSVEDTGIGISPQDLPYIFNRFYRSNEIRAEISGSGLGLSIAKEIVDLHLGEIKVKSNIGANTIFSVTLPTGIS
jgi:signal transduction histidine kinase